jgi:transformation/transcription domain-associated protein
MTPNIQTFITPVGLEGPFSSSIVSIGKALTHEDMEIEDYLPLFIKDDLLMWQQSSKRPAFTDQALRENIYKNADLVVKRIEGLSCKQESASVILLIFLIIG